MAGWFILIPTCPAPGTIPDIQSSLNTGWDGWMDAWVITSELCNGKQYRTAGVKPYSIHAISLNLFLVFPLVKRRNCTILSKITRNNGIFFLWFHLYEVENQTKLIFSENGRVARTAQWWEGMKKTWRVLEGVCSPFWLPSIYICKKNHPAVHFRFMCFM